MKEKEKVESDSLNEDEDEDGDHALPLGDRCRSADVDKFGRIQEAEGRRSTWWSSPSGTSRLGLHEDPLKELTSQGACKRRSTLCPTISWYSYVSHDLATHS